MQAYILRRIVQAIPTLIGASILVFLLMRVVPGDIIFALIADEEGGAAQLPPEKIARLKAEFGLDKPLPLQYLDWVAGIPLGDLGTSMWSREALAPEIAQRFPITFQIAIQAAVFGFVLGLPLGIASALKRGSWIDFVARFVSIFFLAVPTFWLGLLVIMFGTRNFGWMPPIGLNYLWEQPRDNLIQLFWPSIIIGSHLMATVARMSRSTVLEVLREDYIRTARAKGLAEPTVIIRHVLKNSLIPVITITTLALGALLAGTVVMERVFTVPGMGLFLLESIQVRDLTAVQAVVFIMAGSFIVINLLTDLAYGFLDPRISYS